MRLSFKDIEDIFVKYGIDYSAKKSKKITDLTIKTFQAWYRDHKPKVNRDLTAQELFDVIHLMTEEKAPYKVFDDLSDSLYIFDEMHADLQKYLTQDLVKGLMTTSNVKASNICLKLKKLGCEFPFNHPIYDPKNENKRKNYTRLLERGINVPFEHPALNRDAQRFHPFISSLDPRKVQFIAACPDILILNPQNQFFEAWNRIDPAQVKPMVEIAKLLEQFGVSDVGSQFSYLIIAKTSAILPTIPGNLAMVKLSNNNTISNFLISHLMEHNDPEMVKVFNYAGSLQKLGMQEEMNLLSSKNPMKYAEALPIIKGHYLNEEQAKAIAGSNDPVPLAKACVSLNESLQLTLSKITDGVIHAKDPEKYVAHKLRLFSLFAKDSQTTQAPAATKGVTPNTP